MSARTYMVCDRDVCIFVNIRRRFSWRSRLVSEQTSNYIQIFRALATQWKVKFHIFTFKQYVYVRIVHLCSNTCTQCLRFI